MGRTGTVWRCEHEGVTPDIMTYGKAFGGGIMPITGIICRPKMWTQQLIDNPWLLGSPTFGGNPVCCAAAIAAIRYMLANDIPAVCARKGKLLKDGLLSLAAKYPDVIAEVRGVGLMLAVEFRSQELGYETAKGLFARRVMTAGTLVNARTIRFEPTAEISEEDISEVISRLDEALADTRLRCGPDMRKSGAAPRQARDSARRSVSGASAFFRPQAIQREQGRANKL